MKYDKNNKNIYSTLICDLKMFSFSYVEMMKAALSIIHLCLGCNLVFPKIKFVG